jgi:hypothetical protein
LPNLLRNLAAKAGDNEDPEDALIEAHGTVAAVGLVPDIGNNLEAEAEKLSNQWLTKYRVDIKSLSDERQDVYRQLHEMSAAPSDVGLARPRIWLQPRQWSAKRMVRRFLCPVIGRICCAIRMGSFLTV